MLPNCSINFYTLVILFDFSKNLSQISTSGPYQCVPYKKVCTLASSYKVQGVLILLRGYVDLTIRYGVLQL